MGHWEIIRVGCGRRLRVQYRNLYTLETWTCGEYDDANEEELVKLIVDKGAPAPGDAVLLPGGGALVFTRRRGTA